MERRFIKSGVPGLDPILGGGFLANSIVTIGGPSGAGKSTLALQFLYNGAYESDEVGVYICIEENRQDFLFHMSGYEWDIPKAESERKIVFLDYPVHEVDQILSQTSAVAELINSVGAKRVVIDSIMPIGLYFHSDDERKKGFLKLIENIRKWNATTLIVSEDTATEAGWEIPCSDYGIEKFTDGWMDLSYRYDERRGERVRYIEVLKMKGVAHSMKPHQATIGSKGFSLIPEMKRDFLSQKAAPQMQQQPAPVKPAAIQPASPRPRADDEEIVPIEEPRHMRRITMPPELAAQAPPKPEAPKAMPAKAQPKRPVQAPPKSQPKKAQAKGKPDKDVSAAKAVLAAKLAAAKSRILKKSR